MHRAAPDHPSSVEKPRRRRRWLRWFFGLAITLAIILVIVIVAVQIALSTNLPKRLVLGQLEKAMGLHVQAEAMSVGWLGHTSLRNVTLSLPLAEQSLLDVPQLDVQHTNLPLIALTRGVKIDSVTFHHPTLVV